MIWRRGRKGGWAIGWHCLRSRQVPRRRGVLTPRTGLHHPNTASMTLMTSMMASMMASVPQIPLRHRPGQSARAKCVACLCPRLAGDKQRGKIHFRFKGMEPACVLIVSCVIILIICHVCGCGCWNKGLIRLRPYLGGDYLYSPWLHSTITVIPGPSTRYWSNLSSHCQGHAEVFPEKSRLLPRKLPAIKILKKHHWHSLHLPFTLNVNE